MSTVIGIDLGTTNCCIAVVQARGPSVIPSKEGGRTTPSVVAFLPDAEPVVGISAKRQAVLDPENTISSVKRFIGRKYGELAGEIAKAPYKVVRAKNGDAWVEVLGVQRSPEEISAIILQALRSTAEAYLGERVARAVITVPAHFNDAQRQATKDAGAIAGLEVLRIINEPTAASLACGLDKAGDKNIAVFDLGGGTYDITLLRVGSGVFEVLATNGDTALGGDDMDRVLMDWMADEFREAEGIDLLGDKVALQRLKDAAERARIELSERLQTNISAPFITSDVRGPRHLSLTLTRAKLDQLTGELLDRLTGPCEQAMADAGFGPEQIDDVVLVGGVTRMPAVVERVVRVFGKQPHGDVNPDEVVALGAAIQGAVLAGGVTDLLLLDVTPLSLGVETVGGVTEVVIKRNTTIPTRRVKTFTTTFDNQPAVTIHVLQGERRMATDNRSLATFELIGVPPAQRGAPRIDVSFDVDANGILRVSARDAKTGKEQTIRVEPSGGLSRDEVDKMVADAREHAEEDEKRAILAQARAELRAVLYAVKGTLREIHRKLDESELKRLTVLTAQAETLLEQGEGRQVRLMTARLKAESERLARPTREA